GMHIFSLKKARLLGWVLAYLVGLNLLFAIGIFDFIAIDYRGLFSKARAGSNFGIRFDSAYYFIPQYLQSWAYQIVGVYFPNVHAVLLFLLESVPAMVMAGYLIANRRHANLLVNFLVVFFMLYAT